MPEESGGPKMLGAESTDWVRSKSEPAEEKWEKKTRINVGTKFSNFPSSLSSRFSSFVWQQLQSGVAIETSEDFAWAMGQQ